ncbi:MAG: mechanosensitive ion channel family protein [Bacteroidales bacterium]|jgi:small conductance mechanosensitive channel|nr:mechanosensitive ion channel family protein [Bacteroidales bacterium]
MLQEGIKNEFRTEISNELAKIDGIWDKFFNAAITQGPRIITSIISALLIYFVGQWLIKWLMRILSAAFARRKVELSLQKFLLSLLNWSLKIMLVILVITQLGVQTSTFMGILAGCGLAVGMALQGSLSNFAGGILILTLKPFRVGDVIDSSTGISGTVDEINIFSTILVTPQNQLVTVPNGALSNSNITNYTKKGTRRTWFNIGVTYSADLKKTKELLLQVIAANPMTLKEPAPQVVVTELGDSAVNLSVRATTTTANFVAFQEQLIIDCKATLDAAGIEIPFPQHDVHLRKD